MTTHPPTPPQPDDEALARLRAADPAAGLDPDLGVLRAAVAARVDAAAGAPDAVGAARERRRSRWFRVAAVAAGALVVGTVGYGVGRVSLPPPADSPIVLSQGDRTGEQGAEIAAEPSTDAARTMIYPPPGAWRTVFTAEGLSDRTGRAQAWTFDAAGTFSAETATAAARALGLEGEATMQFGSWVVGSTDGRGPSLTLQPDGTTNVSFYDPARDPYVCGTSGRLDALPAFCTGEDLGAAPRGGEAVTRMRELLAALGLTGDVEFATSEMDVPESGAPRLTAVTAAQVLEGQRTGVAWYATFVGTGVQSFSGPLAPLVSLGEYDVVSENEAVRRLGDPRFGSTGGVLPLAELARDAAPAALAPADAEPGAGTSDLPGTADVGPDTAVASPTQTPPPVPDPGAAIPWPVTQVTLTQARLGLAMQYLPDGATVLVPAYELSDGSRSTWSVLAVADGGLDFTQRD